jgi:hypothetical protein
MRRARDIEDITTMRAAAHAAHDLAKAEYEAAVDTDKRKPFLGQVHREMGNLLPLADVCTSPEDLAISLVKLLSDFMAEGVGGPAVGVAARRLIEAIDTAEYKHR